MPDLVEVIKMAALSAVKQSKPTEIYFGQALSASPLQVKLSDKLVLGKANLILPRSVTDWTDDDGTEHHWGIKTGDVLILLRKQGGNQYLILDRKGESS